MDNYRFIGFCWERDKENNYFVILSFVNYETDHMMRLEFAEEDFYKMIGQFQRS